MYQVGCFCSHQEKSFFKIQENNKKYISHITGIPATEWGSTMLLSVDQQDLKEPSSFYIFILSSVGVFFLSLFSKMASALVELYLESAASRKEWDRLFLWLSLGSGETFPRLTPTHSPWSDFPSCFIGQKLTWTSFCIFQLPAKV